MEQSAKRPEADTTPPGAEASPQAVPSEQDPAFAAILASIQRLDGLGLFSGDGRSLVEPAATFRHP